jgi:hypothetical protein
LEELVHGARRTVHGKDDEKTVQPADEVTQIRFGLARIA